MKIVRQDIDGATPNTSAIMVGEVVSQNLVAEGDAPSLRVTAVTFRDGAFNKWHSHSTEQVLIVTHGNGIVATGQEERPIVPGDVVLIPANERHWHGAAPGATMTHLAILLPGEMTIHDE
ncbi:MAG: cupin domain-containing protein [Chloroflexota bacterium]|nr:cupin domain-containing protein [Chloroflexota bacterium]